MPGSPSESEIRTQWTNAVAVLEGGRNYADGTALGLLDTVEQALEGDYLPGSHALAAADYRAALSSLVSASRAQQWLIPVLYEYGKAIRSPYTDASRLMRALYDWFVTNTLTVKGRAITFDTSATAGGSNVGNGSVLRLSTDENGFPLQAVTVETKRLTCRSDRNSGASAHAEQFEIYGQEAGQDGLARASRGSGMNARTFLRSHHAGSGAGGSLLRNSSFSTYDSTATNVFSGWTVTGTAPTQDIVNFYRSHPNADVDGSLKMTAACKIVQGTDEWRTSRLDPDRPYFLRVMVNKSVGSGLGGTVYLRLGSKSASVNVSALSAGWNELYLSIGQDAWYSRFNENGLDVEIEWGNTPTSGYLLFDDVLFAPFDLVDGSYWFMEGGTTPWLVNDYLDFTDTGGAPTTSKIGWWLWVAGLGYLPSTTGSPSVTEPA